MRISLALLALLIAAPAHGEVKLTERLAKAFVASQESAWNAKDARAFSTTFVADAQFVDQARDSHGGVTRNGESTLSEMVNQARRFFSRSQFHETEFVDQVIIAADGRSAKIIGHEVIQIVTSGGAQRSLCAQTQQTVSLRNGRILSHGQTDTDVRCSR